MLWKFSRLALEVMLLVARATECDGDLNEMLQTLSKRRDPNSTTDLVDQLLKAKTECLKSSMECLPALKQVRYRVWPYIQELIHWPHKPWEPMDFHPQVVKAKMSCNGVGNHTMFLLHMWKSAGWSSMDNLKAVSNGYDVIQAFEDNYAWCEQLGYNGISQDQRSSLTFVREPLSRLISGYAEIERTYKAGRYDFLKQAEEGSRERAKIFMDRFFEDGAIYNGHVKPQSEYFAPFSSRCALPIEFVGKTETISEDWKKFMESKHCDAASTPFSNDLGQHPTDDGFKNAMENFFNEISLLAVDATSTSALRLKSVLDADGYAYLRALCWLLLSDYVMFDYDLPEHCDEPEMLRIMEQTKSGRWSTTTV